MAENDWTSQFDKELQAAEQARMAGNEGKARVCARRAAGVVAGAFFQQQGLPASEPNAFERLRLLQAVQGLPPDVYPIVAHFLARVTFEHTLPIDADLIAEARWLKSVLIGYPAETS